MPKFFIYEKDFAGRWTPAFVENMKTPDKWKPKADTHPERAPQWWEVPSEMTLQEAIVKHPAPQEPKP